MSDQQVCEHINILTSINVGNTGVCEECVKQGSTWVHLRTCQTCGVTLCCDDSPHKHMTQHHRHTLHPVIASAQLGERWLWCYPDQLFVEY